jgi:hypothetical protein
MKSLKIILSGLLVVLFLNFGLSQFSMGLKGGANYNSIQLDGLADQFRPDITYIPSGFAGLTAAYQFNPNFRVQSELNFTERGFGAGVDTEFKLYQVNVPIGASIESRMRYLEVPLLFDYTFGNEKIQAFVGAGPYFAYALNGNLRTRLSLIVDVNVSNTELDLSQQMFDRTEFGAVLHSGIVLPVNQRSGFVVDARYNHAFTRIADDTFLDIRLRNKGISLGLGYVVQF